MLLVLLLVSLLASVAQMQLVGLESCPERVAKHFAADRADMVEDFFDALRKLESNGNLCKIEGNKAGPYQISEEYYNEAVEYNPQLRDGGKAFRFVWGEGSKNYSEMVITSYLCARGRQINNQLFGIAPLAALHRGGAIRMPFLSVIREIQSIISNGSKPNDSSEICNPECNPGECCNEGKCFCLNTTSLTMNICPEPCEATEIGGLDLIFLLDDSGSIGEENFNRTKISVENYISSLTIGPDDTRVAVILFSERAILLFNLNKHNNSDTLIEEIRNIEYADGPATNTGRALEILRTDTLSQLLGLRLSNESRHVAIVITDGRSNDRNDTKFQAELLHNQTDFQVFAVGVGNNVDEDELMIIASNTSFVVLLDDFDVTELQRFEEEVRRLTCRIPAPISNNGVNRTLQEGRVSFLQVEIPDDGLTIMVEVNDGRVLVCGSRRDQNPNCRDPSTYEWLCETDGYCDVFVENVNSRKRRQATTTTNSMFIAIEGVESNNDVTMDVMEGDETISNVVSLIPLTDTVIIHNDPLYEVPVTHTPPGMDTATTSLCFQVHGESGSYYNLISDECIQVNVLYEAFKNFSNQNFIKEIGILAQDSENNCTEIRLRANRCSLLIDDTALEESYNKNGIIIIKLGRQSFEITVPNCKNTKGDDIKFEMACQRVQGQRIVHFDVKRGGGIKPGGHGLIGQFWSVPVDVLEYTGNYSGSANNTFVITVNHPSTTSPRTFIAELHTSTWDGKRKQCLYAGSAQSGAINEVNFPNDHVIEGVYGNYEVSGLFESNFQYNQFKEDQCV